MAIQVFVADEQSDHPVDAEAWSRLARAVLGDRGVPSPAELNVLFVDKEAITSLNERFLHKPGPTDVLSFPIEDELDSPPPPPSGPPAGLAGPGREPLEGAVAYLVGDVVICPAVAFENAPEHAGDYESELALLLVHGILHLTGMDHQAEQEAEQMEALEQELLARHFGDPGRAR